MDSHWRTIMKNSISDYDQRKIWRVKLNSKRNSDKDHSPDRYKKDASILNRAMSLYGIKGKMANW